MKNKKDSSKGTVILETSIVLPLFMLIILFVYGFFSVVNAQNQMTHALLQSSKSLSLDPYLTEHVDSVHKADTFWSGVGAIIMDFARMSNDEHFSSKTNWYDDKGTGVASRNSIAEKRFVGYLAGGSESEAEEKLKSLGVVGGLDGIDFDMTVSGDDMTITIKYELQMWFDAFDLGKLPMEQTVTTKLWK